MLRLVFWKKKIYNISPLKASIHIHLHFKILIWWKYLIFQFFDEKCDQDQQLLKKYAFNFFYLKNSKKINLVGQVGKSLVFELFIRKFLVSFFSVSLYFWWNVGATVSRKISFLFLSEKLKKIFIWLVTWKEVEFLSSL